MKISASRPLPVANWDSRNVNAINSWRAQRTSSAAAPLAVFDWDNTSIYGDIGMATARHQLDTLQFKITPQQLAETIPEVVNGQLALHGGVSLPALRNDVVGAYRALWPFIQRGDVQGAKQLPAYQDFRAKLLGLYDLLEATPGVGAKVAYPWLTRLYAGFTPEGVQRLGVEAWRVSSQEPRVKAEWKTASPGLAGHLSYSFEKGVAEQPEMKALYAGLAADGFDVRVLTASLEDVVRGVSREARYEVKPENVFGMRLELDPSGVYSHRSAAHYPTTNGPGKVECIEQNFPSRPVLVGGDSDGDFDMLTAFKETEVRLVFHRNKGPDAKIHSLYAEPLERDGVITVVQGRDEDAGTFRPARDTRPRTGWTAE
jgi:hypothetical protein